MINTDWVQMTNKFKNTCCVCNRSMYSGETILWNKSTNQAMHNPEMCNFLGIRKKMPKRRKVETSQYNFPVEVRHV